MKHRFQQAFTLVELSIVLVIIGLLTGGVLAGQSLIRAAELRTVTSDSQRYMAAANAFRDKYQAIPGDMNNASSFWPAIPGTAGCTISATCGNGNGNGVLSAAPTASAPGETFEFWNELALAGLIEGSYSGNVGNNFVGWPGQDSIPGTNVPRSKVNNNAGWAIGNQSNYGGDQGNYAIDFGNFLSVGALNRGSIPDQGVLKPEEAWNIDTKLDDGLPGRGKIIAHDAPHFATTNACTLSANASDLDKGYNLTNSTTGCAMRFIRII